ncbi:hypothetical protein [Puniceibacterium sediminis]|uniref:DUF2927 domain-containing protein n=1 Tax=Puniceibacterium sediminis TaxID=1608407 RepID=A0A238Y8Y6_9RHOB|nr:hypothetical protein [Puniceibacterium sediminis]SNR67044.1 hypothetical protein SAMN06265370_11541 [Puniceibacterium sediminis]
MVRLFSLLGVLCFSLGLEAQATPLPGDRDAFMALAKKGWVYELRTAMWKHDPLTPPIVINGRDLAGAAICVVGETPHPQSRAVIDTFRALMADVFGKPLPLRYAGGGLEFCGTGRVVYIRLYSDRPPHVALNADLRRMDEVFEFGLPRGREQSVISPAQAQTFFGRKGRATHVLVKQPAPGDTTDLEAAFYASIMIEELYQTFTYGMDILHFDPKANFVSKLEEFPVYLRNFPWDSKRYMQGLLSSNPSGLCRFDVFMLHALAEAPVENTNSDAFLEYIGGAFERLESETDVTVANPDYAPILDVACSVTTQ